jgi:4'-phosphopantetheinyl transferase
VAATGIGVASTLVLAEKHPRESFRKMGDQMSTMEGAEQGHGSDSDDDGPDLDIWKFARGIERWGFNQDEWCPSEAEWQAALALETDPEERARIERFKFRRDAIHSLIGRLLMRKVAQKKLGIPYEEVKLARTAGRKPYIVDWRKAPNAHLYPNFNCNISHHGSWTVLASEPVAMVGVDTMTITAPNGESAESFFKDFTKQFTDFEWSVIKSAATEEAQFEQFFRYWAMKEAYIKATGVGLEHKLNRIEFRYVPDEMKLNSQAAQLYVDDELKKDWRFHLTYMDETHVVCIAKGPPWEAHESYASCMEDIDAKTYKTASCLPNTSFEQVMIADIRPDGMLDM